MAVLEKAYNYAFSTMAAKMISAERLQTFVVSLLSSSNTELMR